MSGSSGFWAAPRHPWPSAFFALLLLGLYEAGLVWLGAQGTPAARTGLDSWLQAWLHDMSWKQVWMPPVLVGGIILVWLALAWRTPAPPLGTTVLSIVLESVVWALMLWGAGAALGPWLDQTLAALPPREPNLSTLAWCVSFVGAGIYEETLFRLILFTLLLKTATPLLGKGSGVFLAVIVSAGLFAAAPNFCPPGGDSCRPVFLFRVVAGISFALLYHYRGFGVAVGCHASYDVLVGVAASG